MNASTVALHNDVAVCWSSFPLGLGPVHLALQSTRNPKPSFDQEFSRSRPRNLSTMTRTRFPTRRAWAFWILIGSIANMAGIAKMCFNSNWPDTKTKFSRSSFITTQCLSTSFEFAAEQNQINLRPWHTELVMCSFAQQKS